MLLMLLACADPAPAPLPGDAAPDFTLNDARGVPHSLSDYAGQVVLLDLSAFW